MMKRRTVVPIVGFFGVGLLTFAGIRCLCDGPPPQATRAATAGSTGEAQDAPKRQVTIETAATCSGERH